jgi:hypothetical protein
MKVENVVCTCPYNPACDSLYVPADNWFEFLQFCLRLSLDRSCAVNTEALSIFTRIAVPATLFSGQDIDPIFEVLQVLPFLEVLFITTGLAANLRVAQFIVSG